VAISRGLKTTFLVHFIVGLIFGLLQLLIPDQAGSMLGIPVPDAWALRLVGAAILAFATSSWFAYRADVWEKVKIVVQMEIVWTVLAALVLLAGLLFGGLAAGEWVNFIIMAAFAVAFIVFYQRE